MAKTIIPAFLLLAALFATSLFAADPPAAKEPKKKNANKKNATSSAPTIPYPPKLSSGKEFITTTSDDFVKRASALVDGVTMAKTAPTVDFAFYPDQDYEGKPWSNWGDSTFANGKYYSAIGDHLAPAGNAFVYEFDPATKKFRKLIDVSRTINVPKGHYAPAKIHSRLGLGSDGWLYFSTHRGSTRVTTPENHFIGDWLLRANPVTAEAEIVERAPIPNHCLPNGMLDEKRLVYYGGTAPGQGKEGSDIQFWAYDLKNRKMLYSGPNGPSRAMILSSTTGKLYYTPGTAHEPLMRFDPATGNPPEKIEGKIGIRASTEETPNGIVYVSSQGHGDEVSLLYAFDVKTEKVETLGPAAVGTNQYVASLKADPSGRYLYYIPGAHGGSDRDGSAVVQYDVKTRMRKVLCCLHPHFEKEFGFILKGTYAVAIDDKGEKLYVTWNISRGSKAWDCCGLTVIHIPASERPL